MRESLLTMLRCPACERDGDWELHVEARDEREIRAGRIVCGQCGAPRAIRNGVVDLLDDPPDYVVREADGLERFAELMRRDGWDRERVLQLPYVELGYWYQQAVGMEQLLASRDAETALAPGNRVLDVGANCCWASAMLAERGLDVVALDISPHVMQGLETADWWFEDRGVYFERVLSLMQAPALASGTFDAVFCCEVLHHNHRANLFRTLRELRRVLKPGGKLFAINEPVRALRSPKLRPGHEVAAFEGHEHAYLRATYLRAARRAGLAAHVVAPKPVRALNDNTWTIAPETPTRLGFQMAAGHMVRRSRPLRSAYLAWRTYVTGENLFMVADAPT